MTWRNAPQSLDQLFVEPDALMYTAKRYRDTGDHLDAQVIG